MVMRLSDFTPLGDDNPFSPRVTTITVPPVCT